MTRSVLASRGIKEAKTGHTLGRLTMQLFYATDFIDRLENEMLPALRSGFVVLTDRYIYSAIARAGQRNLERGEMVEFSVQETDQGWQAVHVIPLQPRRTDAYGKE